MYSNQSFDEKVTGSKLSDDYEICKTETGQKFLIKWSPQDGAPRYLSKSRYASPRSLSKSVPRRKRGMVRYNINRSLNFDVSARRSENFKSPNSSSDGDIEIPADIDNYLSRSAKILRALNINYSPLGNAKLSGNRRINKSLNFDLSPSPKGFGNFAKTKIDGKSVNSIRDTALPTRKINKTLNFDTSSEDSNVAQSLADSSMESMDENQNQTPSNRSAKKSLNYRSPGSIGSLAIPDFSVGRFSGLRGELRDKVDEIVMNAVTPKDARSGGKFRVNDAIDCFGSSTPRNLYDEFDDDGNDAEDGDGGRPRTPENVVRIVPESMSAIKKSHKKERLLGRIGKSLARAAKSRAESESSTNLNRSSNPTLLNSRPTTPPMIVIDHHPSPQRSVSSIKKSHKKDRSKKNLFTRNSDDEISDDGSIFDYTPETHAIPSAVSSIVIDENNENLKVPETKNSYATDEDEENETDENPESTSKRVSTPEMKTPKKNVTSSRSSNSPKSVKKFDPSKRQTTEEKMNGIQKIVETPEKSTENRSPSPVTPENRENFLQRVISDSIKKSHKKIKDTNRKSLFKSRLIQDDLEELKKREKLLNDEEEATKNLTRMDDERASTPENTNSSRLLLSQFSSVKKSHRKDKHRRMINETLHRKKSRAIDDNYDNDEQNFNSSSSSVDFASELKRKDPKNDFSSSENSDESNYKSFQRTPLKLIGLETGVAALSTSKRVTKKFTPKKRKNSLNASSADSRTTGESSSDRGSVNYESAEEEFKIFTPIKKRKSFGNVGTTARRICGDEYSSVGKNEKCYDRETMENISSRCSTPTKGRETFFTNIDDTFETPEKMFSRQCFGNNSKESSPIVRNIENVDDENCHEGRSTPENSSTAVLMIAMSSIKKSHKKDKRGNASRREMMRAHENYEATATIETRKDDVNESTKFDVNYCSNLSPRPSTSRQSDVVSSIGHAENLINDDAKTPPNCLKAKSYLRLLQTSSIKRSHKKVRDSKKFRGFVVDEDLSDDGSLFDETEKSLAMDNESLKRGGDENREEDVARGICTKVRGGEIRGETVLHDNRDAASSRYNGNVSDDGSIFDAEEKLDDPCDIEIKNYERETAIRCESID